MPLRDKIRDARDFRKKSVSVPEWPEVEAEGLYVRSLSIRDALAFEKLNQDLPPEKTSSLYLAFTLCDEGGQLAYDDPAEGVEELLGKDPEVISRLFDEALHLNNGNPKVADEEGKSSPSPSSGSASS